MPTVLTYEQIAERLHTPIATIRYWVSAGKLVAYKPGRHPLIKESDLAAFIESRSVPAVRAANAKTRVDAARKAPGMRKAGAR